MSLDVYLNVQVYEANITHNLGAMAKEAGIYYHLWHPEEIDIWLAEDLIDPLERGLKRMKANPEQYKAFNPENGWENYEAFIKFVENYLEACKAYPEASIRVSV